MEEAKSKPILEGRGRTGVETEFPYTDKDRTYSPGPQ